MKNLLKISLVLAIALFVAGGVQAQNTTEGTITVNVPEYLELIVTSPDVDFIYDEFGATDLLVAKSFVEIKANVEWDFEIAAGAKLLTDDDGHSIAIGSVSVEHAIGEGLAKTALNTPDLEADGSGNSPVLPVTWTLADLGNQYAGTYTAPISYFLVKE